MLALQITVFILVVTNLGLGVWIVNTRERMNKNHTMLSYRVTRLEQSIVTLVTRYEDLSNRVKDLKTDSK